ncbi:MAG: RNA polymerase sigma factor [Defluviitaleaceae bacterium]|nr:RNA polymerase sigma factor [Defluviitaleaceae bacterium]
MAKDKKLLKKASGGDIRAFESLIARYEKLIYNIAYRIMNNPDDTMDICQEVYIKIYQNLYKCQSMDYLKNWICTVTHNACMDELRKRTTKGKGDFVTVDIENREFELVDTKPGSNPEDKMLNKELSETIQQAMGELSDEHRALIVFRDIQGLSYDDIAEITHTSLGTVKSRISRARGRLKKLLTGKL